MPGLAAVDATSASVEELSHPSANQPQLMSDQHPVEYSQTSYAAGEPLPGGAGYPSGMGDGGFEPEKANVIQRYIAALLRFKWIILVLSFAGAAGGIHFARALPDQYMAQATVWVETPPRQGNAAAQPIRSPELLDSFAWVELLESFAVLDPVVREQRLYLSTQSEGADDALSTLIADDTYRAGAYRLTVSPDGAQYALSTSEGAMLEEGAVGDSIGRTLGLSWVPPRGSLTANQVIDFHLATVRGVAQTIADRLQPVVVRDVDFLTITLTGTDAQKTANTVNAVAEQFVEVAADLKTAKLEQLSQILKEQLDVAAQNLNQAEIALQTFEVATITLPSDRGTPLSPGLTITQDPVYENFFGMRIEREQLARDREVIRRVLTDARTAPLSVFALEAIPSLQQAPALGAALADLTTRRAELRVLLQRYTPQNAQVIRAQESVNELESRTIPALAGDLYRELETKDGELADLVSSASAELQQIPPRAIEQARLQRSVEIAERVYIMLQGRYEEAHLAALSSSPDVRLLDEATVPPWSTNGSAKIKLLLMFLAGSLGLGVGGAILLDRLDPKVRYPDQVSADLGLPILGAVPFVRNADAGKSPEVANHAIEAFREIRMNATYAHGTAGPTVFAVSSAEAGDGKSFVSSNLALSFAQQGHRTLVIDGDIRRGRLHHFLKGVRTPGLSDLLAQRVTLHEVLQKTEVPHVTIIGSGTRMHVGPELLGSAAMANYLRELKRQFDVIIIDTPPLGAGVDPYVLAALTGHLLVVVRTGNTNRAFAEAKLKLLDRLPVRVLGAVLNGIPANQRLYRYYSYLPNYGSVEEAPNEQAASLATIS
jgi:polysaccharide biosynthesis transport protein